MIVQAKKEKTLLSRENKTKYLLEYVMGLGPLVLWFA
jgi:hypothetical protein